MAPQAEIPVVSFFEPFVVLLYVLTKSNHTGSQCARCESVTADVGLT